MLKQIRHCLAKFLASQRRYKRKLFMLSTEWRMVSEILRVASTKKENAGKVFVRFMNEFFCHLWALKLIPIQFCLLVRSGYCHRRICNYTIRMNIIFRVSFICARTDQSFCLSAIVRNHLKELILCKDIAYMHTWFHRRHNIKLLLSLSRNQWNNGV